MITGNYDQFTKRARQVMQLAHKAAVEFEHEYIAPEHILCGLLIVGDCAAATILKGLNIDLTKAVADSQTNLRSLPKRFTGHVGIPRAKMVVECAMMEARYLRHDYVGTVHILMGILHEKCGDQENALVKQGVTIHGVREEIKKSMPDSAPPESKD